MRFLTLIFVSIFLLSNCTNSQTKKKTSYVFDNEKILNPSEKLRFDSLFIAHEQKTSNEIVLVTTDNYGGEKDILMYSVKFGEYHGIGKSNKDNGVVIVFSKAKRETRISTGYGIENILKDEIAKRIIDNSMIPKFKEGDLVGGLWQGCSDVVNFLERPENEIKLKEYINNK